MSKRRLIDTNLIVRFLVHDHPEHSAKARALFEACDEGKVELVILPSVLAECVFVLESFYKHPRKLISRSLTRLIESPGVEMAELPVHLDALDRYANSKQHFVDCTIATTAVTSGLAVATFDSGFAKLAGVRVELY